MKIIKEYSLYRTNIYSNKKELLFSIFADESKSKVIDRLFDIKSLRKRAFPTGSTRYFISLIPDTQRHSTSMVKEQIVFSVIKKSSFNTVKALERLYRIYRVSGRLEGISSFGTIGQEGGVYFYSRAIRRVEFRDTDDKKKRIRNLISGRKSALTRTINKLKKIREEHRASLFPDEYMFDPRWQRLFKYILKQKQRVADAKRLRVEDIPSIDGVKPISLIKVVKQ